MLRTFTLIFIYSNHQGFCESFNPITKGDFENLYNAWKNRINNDNRLIISSDIKLKIQTPEFQKIRGQGINAIPFIVNKIKEEEGNHYGTCLRYLLMDITKISFKDSNGHSFFDSHVVEWWEKDRVLAEEVFDTYYHLWMEQPLETRKKAPFTVDLEKDLGNDPNTGKEAINRWLEMSDGPEKERLRPFQRTKYQKLLDLGIPALPHAIDKIKQGDTGLIDALNYWTDDALKKSAQEKGISEDQMDEYCLTWWEENKEHWLLPPMEDGK